MKPPEVEVTAVIKMRSQKSESSVPVHFSVQTSNSIGRSDMRTRSTREHDATDARIEVQSSSETAENEEQSAIDNPRPIRVFGAGRQSVSWPGYMQTAQQLADNRLAAQLAREKELIDRNTSSTESNTWIPHRKKPRTAMHFQNTVLPSLRELAVQVLTQYIEQMPTLEYLDASARHRVAYQVAKMRKFDSIGMHRLPCDLIEEN